jgi:hypothetical protein
MSHPDSDGVAELLEGGSRAAATGALRMVELSQRRLQWAAQEQTRQVHVAGEVTTAQQVALAAVALNAELPVDVTDWSTVPADAEHTSYTLTDDGYVPTVPTSTSTTSEPSITDRTYQEWIAAQRAHLRSGSIDAERLFPQLEPSVAAAAYLDLVDTGEHVAYLRAYDEVLDQASRSPRRLDPSELQRGAQEILAATDRAQALSGWARVATEDARELAQLRKLLVGIGDDSGLVDRLRETSVDLVALALHDGTAGGTAPRAEALIDQLRTLRIQAVLRLDELGTGRATRAPRATADSAAPILDPVIAREARANRLRAEGLDPDALQAALIHDLSFAEPAAAIMGAATSRRQSPLPHEKKARMRRARERTVSR